MTSAARPQLNLVCGSRDIVEALDEALADAKAGKIDGLVMAWIEREQEGGEEHHIWARTTWMDDAPFIWSRLMGAVTELYRKLMMDGLNPTKE